MKKDLIVYATDASRMKGKVAGVIFPKSIDEVKNAIRTSELDIVPRGGGTELVGGTIPNNSLVIDMNKMNKVNRIDKDNSVVHVEAGVSIKELNDKLKTIGYEFPIYPYNRTRTIGGMIACNAFDNRSMRYRNIKDLVNEVEFVNGKSEVIRVGKSDLSEVCGMEGITGIITSAKLKIFSIPNRTASIFQTDDLEEIFSMAGRLKLEKDIVALDFFSREVSKILGFPEKYHILVEFNSSRGKIRDEEYERIINLRKEVYYAMMERGYLNEGAFNFFFSDLKDFIQYLENNHIFFIIHLGTGSVYAFFNDAEIIKKDEVKKMIRKFRGKPSNYSFGITRKDLVDDIELKVIKRVKLRHDPSYKMNKGKVVDVEKLNEISKGFMAKKDVEEIKSFLKEVIKEKTPREEMNEFISKVDEERANKLLEEPKKIRYNEEIDDYRQTFSSQLNEGSVKKIESYTKNISKGVKEADLNDDGKNNRIVKTNSETLKDSGKVSIDEKNLIDKVMGNFFGNEKGNEKEDKEEEDDGRIR
jgi:FAD/FMN-containing dehydrogenase